jgi:DNA modification methylase
MFTHIWDGFRRDSERGEMRVHPTQKPVQLFIDIWDKFESPNKVMDLFLGSGSTLMACEKSERECQGMEMDEYYCDVIINRWQNYTGKKATLESTGKTYEELKQERENV